MVAAFCLDCASVLLGEVFNYYTALKFLHNKQHETFDPENMHSEFIAWVKNSLSYFWGLKAV
jgi:hypothetical protein